MSNVVKQLNSHFRHFSTWDDFYLLFQKKCLLKGQILKCFVFFSSYFTDSQKATLCGNNNDVGNIM